MVRSSLRCKGNEGNVFFSLPLFLWSPTVKLAGSLSTTSPGCFPVTLIACLIGPGVQLENNLPDNELYWDEWRMVHCCCSVCFRSAVLWLWKGLFEDLLPSIDHIISRLTELVQSTCWHDYWLKANRICESLITNSNMTSNTPGTVYFVSMNRDMHPYISTVYIRCF